MTKPTDVAELAAKAAKGQKFEVAENLPAIPDGPAPGPRDTRTREERDREIYG